MKDADEQVEADACICCNRYRYVQNNLGAAKSPLFGSGACPAAVKPLYQADYSVVRGSDDDRQCHRIFLNCVTSAPSIPIQPRKGRVLPGIYCLKMPSTDTVCFWVQNRLAKLAVIEGGLKPIPGRA